jgi:signal peptidase
MDAMSLLKRIPSKRGNGVFRQSIELINAGQVNQARWFLSQELARNGNEYAAAWALMAHLAHDRAQAIQCMEQVTRLKPDNLWARERLRDLRNQRPAYWQAPAISIPPFYPPLADDEWTMENPSNSWGKFQDDGFDAKREPPGVGIPPDFHDIWPHGLEFRSLTVPWVEEVERPKASRTLARTFRGVLDALMMLVIVGALVSLLAPRLLGANLLVVLSQSMEPNIPMGSIVVSQPVAAADEIGVGDVITFQAPGPDGDPALITHRVVEVLGGGIGVRFRTQGDAVEDPDMSLVSSSDLVGRVWLSLPLVGYLIAFIRTPVGYLTIVGLPAALLILSEWVEILRSIREQKRPRVVRVPLSVAGGGD